MNIYIHGADVFFGSQVNTQKLPPAGAVQSLLTRAYLKASEEEVDAYRFLGVGTATLSGFYVEAVFPRLGELEIGVSEEAVLGMLGSLPQLCREDDRFWDRLSNLAFVKTGAGKLARPFELYDPSVCELQELLEGGAFYPAASFLKPELIATLVRLGLQTSLDRAGILKVARSIAASLDKASTDKDQVVQRGRSLLKFLARQASALGLDAPALSDDPLLEESDRAFRHELRGLAWVPVRQDVPRADIPWVAGRKVVAAPNNVRLASDLMLCSHAMGICADEVENEIVCEFLGWREAVAPVVLALQLLQYASLHGQEVEVNPLQQPLSETPIPDDVRSTVTQIYGLLCQQVEEPRFGTVKAQLRGQRCVLIANAFVCCDNVALTCDSDAAPLLQVLPELLVPYQHLFTQLGVRERFQGRDYVGALERLARANRGQSLEPELLTLAARLAKEAAQYKMANADKSALWLPDANGEMVHVQSLVYDDAPWLSSTLSDVQFLHKDIDNEVAEALGLRSVRKLLISGELHMRDLACPSPEWLRQQLRHTPDVRELPSHLVDCADTLGARHVHILFDFRTHHAQSVLQPNLASLQGPAIVVYLEGLKMTAEELCRLQNVPLHKQGLQRPSRVGAGLNSMYMSTDVPCIISGEGFFFFDPKGTHFVDAEQKVPRPVGKAHIFVNSDMPKKFADQFEPFKVFGFDPNRPFPGTLIRLPLKVSRHDASFVDSNEKEAESSKDGGGGDRESGGGKSVFDARMTEGDLENMLACCSKILGPECLLFMEHVESVEVSSWRDDEIDMKLMFKTCLQSPVSPALRQARAAMTTNKDWQKFNLMSVFGSAPAIRHQFQLGITSYEPARDLKHTDRWLIASTLGTKSARKMALEHKNRGWIPIASVAAKLSGSQRVAPEVDGHVFAFQKVSHTGLPVHVNAWFEVKNGLVGWDTEREGGREGERERESTRASGAEEQACHEWNRELFGCVVDCYLDLLTTALPQVFIQDPSLMYNFWPKTADMDGAFRTLVHRPLFLQLAKMQIFLLPNGQMANMTAGVFRPDATSESLNLLFRHMFPMFICPAALADEFRAAGLHEVSEVSPDRVRQRLRKDPKCFEGIYATFTRSSQTQGEARDKFTSFVIDTLEFCLSDLSAQSFLQLHGLLLLPVTGGQLVTFPSEAIVARELEHKLLPAFRDNMVHVKCVERLSMYFLNVDFQKAMGLVRFSPPVLAANLHLVLPRHWKGTPLVSGYSRDAALDWIMQIA